MHEPSYPYMTWYETLADYSQLLPGMYSTHVVMNFIDITIIMPQSHVEIPAANTQRLYW